MRVIGPEGREVAPRREPARRSFDEALERTATVSPPQAGRRLDAPALPELREAARAIPPAIWSGRASGGAAVELAFGRELSVELRQVAGGIELEVRASDGLARAARVDLPALVEALRARGVAVVRAEVRAGPNGAGRSRTSQGRGTPSR